jgi:acyl-CoA synthetase (NDP forming)
MSIIDLLFRPGSVAVVGASADPTKTSGRPIGYLRRHGYAGRIYPVNPRVQDIDGLPCFADIDALPETPDIALVLLGPDRAVQAVEQLARRNTPAAIVLASGFGETGERGAQRQLALRQAAGGMRLLGPNTIGLANLTDRIMLCASGAMEMESLEGGSIAVVSQSGGILGSLLSRASAAGIGFSKLVSTGNEADLEVSDFIEYLAGDEATRVIALYMEGLRHPERFRAAVGQARRAGKPVVVYKVGRSEAGARSAVSHTGALAGADDVYDAFFRQIGVLRAHTFADLLDVPAALATGRPLKGRRVAILTSTGGAGTLLADSLGLAGFDTPPPGAATAARLRALQNDDQLVLDRNPIDVTLAGLQPDLLKGSITALMDSDDYDAVACVVGSSALAHPRLAADAMAASLDCNDKPVVAYVSPHAPHVLANVNRGGIPAFVAPESVASVLEALYMATRARENEAPDTPTTVRPPAMVPDFAAGSLNEAQAKQLFSCFGIPSVREQVAATPERAAEAAASLGGPVVLKVLSARIVHKTEVDGVRVGLQPDSVAQEARQMHGRVARTSGFEPEGFLVQEQVDGATEVILGYSRDPQLGPVILVGLGGTSAELFKDTSLRLAPVDHATARDMVHELKGYPLLDGYRGRPKADVGALVDAIVAFSDMAMQMGARLLEAEINPLFVLAEGEGVRAADGVAILGG